MSEDKETPLNSDTATQPLIETPTKETPTVTPDVQTTTKPEVQTTESKDNDAITRLNGRLDDLERKYNERSTPEKIEARQADTAPKSSHPWFRNPFVSG